MDGAPRAEPDLWRRLRALLIGLVLVLQWIDAMPLPEIRARDFQYPVAQAEVERWSGLLGQIGVDIPPDELTVKAPVTLVSLGFESFAKCSAVG